MSKAVKRVCKTKINDGPKTKSVKLIDFSNLTKDISILQTFYDLIDAADYDVVEDYLTNNDFNDFLNFFASHHLYKPEDFSLIFKVSSEILMRIVADENKKHILSGQAFAETFLSSHKQIIYLYLKKEKSNSRLIYCLKFLTALILQGKDIALKAAININFLLSNYVKLLDIRKLTNEEDVHTCVLNCYASFFVMDSNYLIMKACEDNGIVGCILKGLRYDRLHNVQLILETLHEKIIKNNSVSKTAKLKIFSASNLRFLLAVYEWKGEARSYDEFKKLSTVDKDCGVIHSQLHEMLLDLCSSHQSGIVFIDNLLCQSAHGNLNKKLFYLITSEGMEDFFSHQMKHELLIAILTACPDLVNPFVEYLVGLMIMRKSELWSDVFKYIVQSYGLMSCDKINSVLTEANNYNNGDKFTDIAMIICAPSKSLIELLSTDENIRLYCEDNIRELRNKLIDNCEKVLTWINVSDVFRSQQQKSQYRLNVERSLMEIYMKCGWICELNALLLDELNDVKMFVKSKETKEIETEEEIEESFDTEISDSATNLMQFNNGISNPDINGNQLLKKCYEHFMSSPFNNVCLLKLLGETLKIGELSLKKKYRHCLVDKLTTNEFFSDNWVLLSPENEAFKTSESKRNCILNVIITIIDSSKSLKERFFERVHPLRLLNVYGASLSSSDQKILYLIMLHSYSGIVCSDYNFILFGTCVSEYYSLECAKSPIMKRPIINAQCFNLIEDERLLATIYNFPISWTSPIDSDHKLNLTSQICNIYDPFFILEWISQFLNINKTESDSKLELDYGIDIETLFSKHIISFLIACQTSCCRHIRRVSKQHLMHLLEMLTTCFNASSVGFENFPMKMQLQMILYHFLHTLSSCHDNSDQISSIITNFYVKLLKMLTTPEKEQFSSLMDILILNPQFDLQYVPNFLKLIYSPDIDARHRQKWCLSLLADSVKSAEDFRILLNTKVFHHVLSLYDNFDINNKKIILNLIKNSVKIPKVAVMLYNFPQFIMWLNFRANFKKEKINHYLFLEIIQSFINSLKSNDKINIEELEMVLKLAEN